MEELRGRPLVGIFVFTVLAFLAFFHTTLLLAPSILLILFVGTPGKKVYRAWGAFVQNLWFSLATAGLELALGVKVRVYGDMPQTGERALILCNHRTRVDWVFLWCLCLRTRQLSQIRFVLKDSLKSIPGVGWAMQMFMFIFMTRDKSKDLIHMQALCEYAVGLGNNVTPVIFPEGTDLSESNLKKSQQFCVDKGLPVMHQVLQPKYAGFQTTLCYMHPSLDAVYDVTIAYVDYIKGERATEFALVLGTPPREVHMFVKRTSIGDMPDPTNEDAVKNWIDQSFKAKEKLLSDYYESGIPFPSELEQHKGEYDAFLACIRALVVSSIFTASVTWVLYKYIWVRYFMVCSTIMSTVVTKYFGGFDNLELALGNRIRAKGRAIITKNLKELQLQHEKQDGVHHVTNGTHTDR